MLNNDCKTGFSPTGHCGSAAYCGKGNPCCAGCNEDCNMRCGWYDAAKNGEDTKDYELKPCPFCGGNAAIRYFRFYRVNSFYADCDECSAKSNTFYTIKEAVEAWNMRTDQMSIEGGGGK